MITLNALRHVLNHENIVLTGKHVVQNIPARIGQKKEWVAQNLETSGKSYRFSSI